MSQLHLVNPMHPTMEEWRVIEHLLAVRSGGPRGHCEVCGRESEPGVRELSIQHRQARGMGGTRNPLVHDLTRLVFACAGFSRRLAGVLGCHGLLESHPLWARKRGLGNLPDTADPAIWPVVLYGGRRVLLDYNPIYLTCPDGAKYVNIPDPVMKRQKV
jgi:hypothetical protein